MRNQEISRDRKDNYQILISEDLSEDLSYLENFFYIKYISEKEYKDLILDTKSALLICKDTDYLFIDLRKRLHNDMPVYLFQSIDSMDTETNLSELSNCFLWNLPKQTLIIEGIEKILSKFFSKYKNKKTFLQKQQKVRDLKKVLSGVKLILKDRDLNLQSEYKKRSEFKKKEQMTLKFTNEVYFHETLESFFRASYTEFKKHIDFLHLYFLIQNQNGSYSLYYWQNRTIYVHDLDQGEGLGLLKEVQLILADSLQRPILSLAELRFGNKDENYLLFELQKPQEMGRQSHFYQWWEKIENSFSLVLAHMVGQYKNKGLLQVWQKTFFKHKEPLAIIGEEGEFLEINPAFGQLVTKVGERKLKRILKKVDGNLKGDDFEYQVFIYNIQSQSGKLVKFCHLVDLQKRNFIYSDRIHTEKIAALGLLAGNFAHELSNPLSGLKIAVEDLLGESHSEQINRDLLEISNGVNRCLDIIENLKGFTGGDQREITDVSIEELVEKTLSLLKSIIGKYEVKVSIASDLVVKSNFYLLQQVLFNLLHNSCQALGADGLIEITSHKKQNQIYLNIIDNGIGIPEKHLKRIFDPFFTTKDKGAGTGLGLSICKRIVEGYGGRLEVEANRNKGSAISVVLPL